MQRPFRAISRPPPGGRTFAHESPEYSVHVGLIGKATFACNPCQGNVCRQHESARAGYSAAHDIQMRGIRKALSERAGEVENAEFGNFRKQRCCEQAREIVLDVCSDTPDLPARQAAVFRSDCCSWVLRRTQRVAWRQMESEYFICPAPRSRIIFWHLVPATLGSTTRWCTLLCEDIGVGATPHITVARPRSCGRTQCGLQARVHLFLTVR